MIDLITYQVSPAFSDRSLFISHHYCYDNRFFAYQAESIQHMFGHEPVLQSRARITVISDA